MEQRRAGYARKCRRHGQADRGKSQTTPPKNMTAVEDLKTYQKFAQAHVDGLKNLISSFDTLYAAMPDAQKKIADEVFRLRTSAAASHG